MCMKEVLEDKGTELILPAEIEVEEVILGAMLLGGEGINEIIDKLKPYHFYKKEHQKIYDVIIKIFAEGHQVDIISVSNALKLRNELDEVGGMPYLAHLTSRVITSASLEHYAQIVIDKFIAREIIKLGKKMMERGCEPSLDVAQFIEEVQKNFYEIIDVNLKREVQDVSSILLPYISYINDVRHKGMQLRGVPSGFSSLDRVTGGFNNSDLVVIASRPGMGKSAFILNVALNAIKQEYPVAIFSIEMNSEQLIQRILAMETGIALENFRKINTLTDEQIEMIYEASERIKNYPLFIDDTPAISLFELRTKARRLKVQNNIKMIIVDYLQLITIQDRSLYSREQEVSFISRSLKTIAKELDIPVIAVSQLNREVEKRRDYRPHLSDLRESGAIEQDADLIIFLYRPEYYKIKEIIDANNEIKPIPKGYTEVIIAKHRHGPTDTIALTYLSSVNKFDDVGFAKLQPIYGETSLSEEPPF